MSDNPVVTLGDIALKTQTKGDKFEARFGKVTPADGVGHLGARLTVVAPGKRAWPYHCHHANDEMFVILDGAGTLRLNDKEFPLKAGDVAICPAGGSETCHQIINSGDQDLKYLAISSMHAPDIAEYPDSGKFGVFAGIAPGGDAKARSFSGIFKSDGAVDYWLGETNNGDD